MVAIDPHDLNAEQKRAASAKRYFVLTRPDQQFLLIVLGVLFAVAGSMVSIFYAFAGRVSEIRDEDW